MINYQTVYVLYQQKEVARSRSTWTGCFNLDMFVLEKIENLFNQRKQPKKIALLTDCVINQSESEGRHAAGGTSGKKSRAPNYFVSDWPTRQFLPFD